MLKRLTNLLSNKKLVDLLLYVLGLVATRTPSKVDDKLVEALTKAVNGEDYSGVLVPCPTTKAKKTVAKTKKA